MLLYVYIMVGMLTINTQFRERWEWTLKGGYAYIDGESMPLCVDWEISLEDFMKIVYKAQEINPTECKIKAKAIFIDNI